MISDLERIGDQAADIAELTPYITEETAQKELPISQMARCAVSMVTGSVDAFVREDLDLARKIIQEDDQVDAYFSEIKEELIQCIVEKTIEPKAVLDLLMAAKYFERIGDHAVNVAEWVEYSITGVHKSSEHHGIGFYEENA